MKISPSDIRTRDHFWDTFDKNEIECAARNIVIASQKKGDWFDFTEDDINIGPWGNFFVVNGYLSRVGKTKYRVLPEFVMKLSKYLKKGVISV